MIILEVNWHFIKKHPAYFLAFGCGIGLVPKAQGTFGSISACFLMLLFYYLQISKIGLGLFYAALFIVGIFTTDRVGKKIQVADHPGFVIDEIVAMSALLMVIPFGWKEWTAIFLLFRFFDITKPYPIHRIDSHLKNGLGVMLDDLIAAFYALVSYLLLLKIFGN